ncbi:MAG: phosphatidylserine decarboxylase family protein [Dissulfurispiraceae bacterium]
MAREGYPFIIFSLFATLIVYFIGGMLAALVPFVLTVFMAFFFRDPERSIPEVDDIFVSPADGKVILIQKAYDDRYTEKDVLEIGIFMSPFNVHVNRAPCDGTVDSVTHTPGRFFSAFKHAASLQNENVTMVLITRYGKIVVRQVAGFLARRAICRVKSGDILKKGDRFGIIKFSSRLDLYLPPNTAVNVKVGDPVRAGQTILGYMN